ncbi:MAG TPA: hypothetical protein VN728_02850 [Stellaceae bacterium]|jgi:hypothetical protein|nr:hypothetical protein [Stellaceae bacterium]
MHGYRCLFLRPDGCEAAREEFEAESDNDAVIVARALYAERVARDGLELWEDTRRVLAEERR